jgi:hypothetical protein
MTPIHKRRFMRACSNRDMSPDQMTAHRLALVVVDRTIAIAVALERAHNMALGGCSSSCTARADRHGIAAAARLPWPMIGREETI